jgi:hypothetical protein
MNTILTRVRRAASESGVTLLARCSIVIFSLPSFVVNCAESYHSKSLMAQYQRLSDLPVGKVAWIEGPAVGVEFVRETQGILLAVVTRARHCVF